MPKALEFEDGSDLGISKNRTFSIQWWFWADLAGVTMVKRSVSIRPLFSLLLLVVFAISLTARILIRKGGIYISIEHKNNVLVRPVFNATLLKYAAIDIGEAKSKQEIEQLLEGNFASQGRYKSFSTWRRYNNRDIRASTSRSMPVSLKSPLFYRHWLDFRKVLQDWSRNKRFHPDIMNELVGLIKNRIDRHNGLVSSNKKYGSCAIVGNSGILLQKDYGELIDSHDMVFRLNNARTSRFEQHVGSKTNISFVNSNILHLCARRVGCFCHPYGANVPMVMYVCQPIHIMDYTICNTTHKAPLIITDSRFDMLCSRIVKYYSLKRFADETGRSFDDWSSVHDGSLFHYSSGFQAVMLGLGTCEKVSIFGFGKSEQAKHHYHTNQKAELHLHDYVAEYDFYHDLMTSPQVIPFISEKFRFPPVKIYM